MRLGECDEVHQEELDDLAEVRQGERAQGALRAWALGMGMGMRVSTGTHTRQFCLGHCEKVLEPILDLTMSANNFHGYIK